MLLFLFFLVGASFALFTAWRLDSPGRLRAEGRRWRLSLGTGLCEQNAGSQQKADSENADADMFRHYELPAHDGCRTNAGGLKDGVNDLVGDAVAISLQSGAGGGDFLLDLSFGLRNLLLGAFAGLGHGGGTGLDGLLAAIIQSLEYGQLRFAQTGFILSGALRGGGDIGARLLNCSLGTLTTLGQHSL